MLWLAKSTELWGGWAVFAEDNDGFLLPGVAVGNTSIRCNEESAELHDVPVRISPLVGTR